MLIKKDAKMTPRDSYNLDQLKRLAYQNNDETDTNTTGISDNVSDIAVNAAVIAALTANLTDTKIPKFLSTSGVFADSLLSDNGVIVTNSGNAAISGTLAVTGEASLRIAKIGDGGITDYVEFKADGEIVLHGTARVTVMDFVDAGALRSVGAKPATLVKSGLSCAYSFADAVEANQETVCGTWVIPSTMEKAEGITLMINWYANGVSPGDVKWEIEYLWIKLNEDETVAGQETLTATSTASATSNGMILAEFSGIDIPDSDDMGLFFTIKRLSADAADTIAAAVLMRGRGIKYTVNKLGTAT